MANFLERTCWVASGESRDTFTTIWRIHYPAGNNMICVESPEFNLDFLKTTYWNLGLIRNTEFMTLYLYRNKDGPDTVHIDFELSLLTLGELPQLLKVCRNYTFSKESHYFYNFFRLADVFEKNFHLYLVNNSLTVRCRMWHPSQHVRPVQCFISTVFTKESVSFNWLIKDYFVAQTESMRRVLCLSPPLREQTLLSLILVFMPKTKIIDYVRISATPFNSRKLARFVCTIAIVDKYEDLQNVKTQDCPKEMWLDSDFLWDFSYSLNETLLLDRKDFFMPDDVLTFRFEFEFWWCRDDECDLRLYESRKTPTRIVTSDEYTETSSFTLSSNPSSSDDFQGEYTSECNDFASKHNSKEVR